MASTTRSSWSGTLALDLIAIPVSLATTVREEREESIKTLCACHHVPIDKTERCGTTMDRGPDKVKGVKLADGTYRVIPENEWAATEQATKDDALAILDVQPLSEFPMAFSTGTYYVRAKKDDRAAAGALAALIAGLAKTRMGAAVKLCKSEKQTLAVLWSYQGYALLSYVPFSDQFNRPGDQERAHMKVEVNEATVDRVVALLQANRAPGGFQWAEVENSGLKLRQALVDRLIADTSDGPRVAPAEAVPNLMEQLEASLKVAKRTRREPVKAAA